MSENEKRLTPEREKELRAYFAGRGPIDLKGQEFLAEIDALDALLAEHRAEVEKLTAERDAARQSADDWKVCAGREREAALEEAALVAFDGTCERCGKPITLESGAWWHVPPHDNQSDHFAGPGKHRASTAGRIRSLKSQPARQYVDAEKVREVLRDLLQYGRNRAMEARSTAQTDVGGRMVAWTAEQVGDRLGMDLDAQGDGKDVHTEHCCQRHGCKYGDAACTVTSNERMQSFPCADCEVSL